MVLNPDKYYFLTPLEFQDAQPNFSYDNITIKNVSEEKRLLLSAIYFLSITIKNVSEEKLLKITFQ